MKVLKSKLFNYIMIVLIILGLFIYFILLRKNILNNYLYQSDNWEHTTWYSNFTSNSALYSLSLFEYLYQYGLLYNSTETVGSDEMMHFNDYMNMLGIDESDDEYQYILQCYRGGFNIQNYINCHTEDDLRSLQNVNYFPFKQSKFYMSFFRGKIYILEEEWPGVGVEEVSCWFPIKI